MKNTKRILALLGVILLLLMYGSTMVFALADHPQADRWLQASLYCTLVVPILLYAYILVYRVLHPGEKEKTTDKKERKIRGNADTVILDIGNVLVQFNWSQLFQDLGYDEEKSLLLEQAVFKSNDWEIADNGIRTEEEILQSFIDNAPAYEKEIRHIFHRLGETIQIFPYTEEWLKQMRDMNLKLYYLSNYSQPLYEQTKDTLSFLSDMDGGYMSYEIHCMKPDMEIFQKLVNDFDLNPKTCVFIDDRLENVAGARAFGMKAIHFTNLDDTMEQLMEMIP